MRKVFVLLGVGVFCMLLAITPLGEAIAKKGPQNTVTFWVHRRDPGDADAKENKAVVLKLEKEGAGKVKATVWTYSKYQDKKYTERSNAIVLTGTIEEKGNDDGARTRHEIRLKKGSAEYAYLTLFKGRDTSSGQSGRSHQRLILRWHIDSVPPHEAEKAKGSDKTGDGCNDPPNDDPMEEEPLEPDDEGNPPENLEDPQFVE